MSYEDSDHEDTVRLHQQVQSEVHVRAEDTRTEDLIRFVRRSSSGLKICRKLRTRKKTSIRFDLILCP